MDNAALDMLTTRLRAVEDRLAILDLLAGAAMSADVASESYWQATYAEDAIMDRGTEQLERGRDAILAIVRGPGQQAAVDYGMSHLASAPHITIAQDCATATGYILVVVPGASTTSVALPGKGTSRELAIYHLTVNRWDLRRTADGWRVVRRTIRPIGTDDAREMIRSGIEVGNLSGDDIR